MRCSSVFSVCPIDISILIGRSRSRHSHRYSAQHMQRYPLFDCFLLCLSPAVSTHLSAFPAPLHSIRKLPHSTTCTQRHCLDTRFSSRATTLSHSATLSAPLCSRSQHMMRERKIHALVTALDVASRRLLCVSSSSSATRRL